MKNFCIFYQLTVNIPDRQGQIGGAVSKKAESTLAAG
jgi:hypothetical protein